MSSSNHYELVTKTILFLGVLALGMALGTALGLAQLQTSCIQAGVLPQPGASLLVVDLASNPCWQGAQVLQSAANASGLVGGGLLIAGGLLDRYEGRVRGVLH